MPPSQRGLPGPPCPSPLPPSQAGNKAAFSWPVCPRPGLAGAAQGHPALVTGHAHRLEGALAFMPVSSLALRRPGPASGSFSNSPDLTPELTSTPGAEPVCLYSGTGKLGSDPHWDLVAMGRWVTAERRAVTL